MRTAALTALALCAAYPLDAAGQSYSQCRSDGAAYYREIGSWPYLSTGESARAKVALMCSGNVNAFASYRTYLREVRHPDRITSALRNATHDSVAKYRTMSPWPRVLGMAGLVALVIFVYFLPTIVTVKRKAHHDAAIVLLNILLGWTLVFWVAALLWAMSDETEKEAATRRKAMRKMAEAQ